MTGRPWPSLQVDDAKTLDVQPRAPRPARHREHVRRVIVAGEFGPGHGTGEDDGVTDAEALRQALQGRCVGTLATSSSPRR